MKSVSYQFSRSVVSDSLWPHEPQHARPPCPSPTPGIHSNSCPLSWWCHPAISSSVIPFSSCPQSLPASESFPMSQLFTWGGQSIGASASASVLPMDIQGWFPFGLTGWISLHSKGLSKVFSNTTVQKRQFFSTQPSLWSSSHIHTWLLEKPPEESFLFFLTSLQWNSHNGAISLLGVHPNEPKIGVSANSHTRILLVAPSIITKRWRPSKCLSAGEWINKWSLSIYVTFFFFFGQVMQFMGSQFPNQGPNPGHSSESPEQGNCKLSGDSPSIHMMEYYLAVKRRQVVIHATMWMKRGLFKSRSCASSAWNYPLVSLNDLQTLCEGL